MAKSPPRVSADGSRQPEVERCERAHHPSFSYVRRHFALHDFVVLLFLRVSLETLPRQLAARQKEREMGGRLWM